ncbi:MAG: hypothetical protein LBV69_01160 [Bacteroidales bacterium]|jgi:hypothetical protein|nr:hypothetical protein [Bacteroidales bacterium]
MKTIKIYVLLLILNLIYVSIYCQREMKMNFKGDDTVKYKAYEIYLTKKCNRQNEILDSLIKNLSQNETVSLYYKLISKADDLFMYKKFILAGKVYKEAFLLRTIPFRKDLYKALTCELLSSKNYETIKYYISLLIKKNEEKDILIEIVTKYDLEHKEDLYSLIDTMKSGIDTILLNKLNSLLNKDQEIRKYTRKRNCRDTDSCFLAMLTIDTTNLSQLMLILDSVGLITEDMIGSSGFFALKIISQHNSDMQSSIQLLPNVINGNIDARDFHNLLNAVGYLYNNNLKLEEENFIIKSKSKNFDEYLYETKLNRRNLLLINYFREKLYLESFNEFKEKVIFDFIHTKDTTLLFSFYNLRRSICIDNDKAFYGTLKTKIEKGSLVNIYFRSNDDKKRLKKQMKEFYKKNTVRPD